jgi:hypothetical protein
MDEPYNLPRVDTVIPPALNEYASRSKETIVAASDDWTVNPPGQ